MARRSNLIRWGGLVAMLGSLIGLLLAPIITSAYSLLEKGAERTPPWELALGTVLGLLLLVAGSALLGIGLPRASTPPHLGAWLLVLALPGIALLTLLGFGNVPSGPALWFCFAWLVLE